MSDLADNPSLVARGRTYWPVWGRMLAIAACILVVAACLTWLFWKRPVRDALLAAPAVSGWGKGTVMPPNPIPATPVVAQAPIKLEAPAAVVVLPSPVAVIPKVNTMGFWEDAGAAQRGGQSANHAAVVPVSQPATDDDPDVATPGGGRGSSDYASRMQTTKFADAAPRPHRFHRMFTIEKDTLISCTPPQPIASNLPGPLKCIVDDDVWSMEGHVNLLPRGTKISGSIERGLGLGEDRLFVIWTTAQTPEPDGQVIELNAPGADEMGQSGVPGSVNDHLWKRVKTALLLSSVDIAGSSISALAQRGNGNTYLNLGSAGSTANSLGQMAFGRDLNIPSTLYRGGAQPLGVYVNRYIDLFRYYRLTVAK